MTNERVRKKDRPSSRRALRGFSGRRALDRVTEAMNEVIDALDNAVRPFSKRAARRVLRKTEW